MDKGGTMRTVNLTPTPWTVVVYSGFAHWDKPIKELEASFCTEEGAKVYAGVIKICRPEYRTEIKKED